MRQPPPVDACFVAVDYRYPWAGLITQYKFHDEPGWAGTLAQLLTQAPGVATALDDADLVLPMPLAPERLRGRGFNQALEIARHLAPARVRADLLLRLRETAPQSALSLAERLANVRGAFGPDPLRASELHGRQVVLVDDVMTSGASLFAAAAALRGAGVRSVVAMAVARTEAPE